MSDSIINIISHSVFEKKIGGPQKVIVNTLKGLELINQPYVLNRSIYNYKYNWIHDSIEAVIEAGIKKIPVVMGPNIVVLPSNLPKYLPDISNSIYLHPSQWCVDIWLEMGYNKSQLKNWPAGIDTTQFISKPISRSNKVLIYFKRRKRELLDTTIDILKKQNLTPILIEYGKYQEEQYKRAIQECSFGIYIGISESQGIGLLEALASNLPLIVIDVNNLFESSSKVDFLFPESLKHFKPTSAPYFDNTCGIIINNINALSNAIIEMNANLYSYQPSTYIQNNLGLEKQARDLMNFFKILEHNNSTYFNGSFKNGNDPFKLSLKGKMIYYSFLLKRKTITASRLIKTKFNI